MATTRFAVTDETLPFGPAEVFFGDATVVGGLTAIGLVEGDVVAEVRRRFNNLTFPEHTGEAPLRTQTQTDGITVTLPLLITDEAMIDRLSPQGEFRLGDDNFQTVLPTEYKTLLIISRDEVPSPGGLATTPGAVAADPHTWAVGMAPEKALWVWRAMPMLTRLVWGFTDFGRRFVEVPFEAHYDPSKPAGQKLATFGDPIAKGIPVRV